MAPRARASVFVNWIDLEADLWEAVWQEKTDYRSVTGTRQACVSWAGSQEADLYWIFDGKRFIPLDPEVADPR
jgi:hypothetical protein